MSVGKEFQSLGGDIKVKRANESVDAYRNVYYQKQQLGLRQCQRVVAEGQLKITWRHDVNTRLLVRELLYHNRVSDESRCI